MKTNPFLFSGQKLLLVPYSIVLFVSLRITVALVKILSLFFAQLIFHTCLLPAFSVDMLYNLLWPHWISHLIFHKFISFGEEVFHFYSLSFLIASFSLSIKYRQAAFVLFVA